MLEVQGVVLVEVLLDACVGAGAGGSRFHLRVTSSFDFNVPLWGGGRGDIVVPALQITILRVAASSNLSR